MSPTEEKEKISAKELYPALVQLITYSETISWNRFSIFLLFNSILVLAWSAVITSDLHDSFSLVVLVAIGCFGVGSGLLCAKLGKRGRAFVKYYLDLASDIENDTNCWSDQLKKYSPLTESKKRRDDPRGYYASSYYLLRIGPWCFSIFHGILLLVTLLKFIKWGEMLVLLETFLRCE